MNIVNVGYGSTNYYVIGSGNARLLVDVGWPGTLPKLQHEMKRHGVALGDIKYLLVTHYHPDHAGLAQELKEKGVGLIVLDTQVAWIPLLRRIIKPSYPYHEITPHTNIQLGESETRKFLEGIGIAGEIISTPGHSDDSVTLILDEGMAFTGDLTFPPMATEEQREQVERSWEAIRSRGVKTIYPAHGPVRGIGQ